jgi:predicted secreted protein
MGSASDLELRVGEERSLRFAGLGTAGYRWVPEVEGDAEVVDVRSTGLESAGSDAAAGASADETFALRANRVGEVTVRFLQRRPWEPADTPPANEQTIRLRVT